MAQESLSLLSSTLLAKKIVKSNLFSKMTAPQSAILRW
jgi:hypothetical protein